MHEHTPACIHAQAAAAVIGVFATLCCVGCICLSMKNTIKHHMQEVK
jgi:hypothetical protein